MIFGGHESSKNRQVRRAIKRRVLRVCRRKRFDSSWGRKADPARDGGRRGPGSRNGMAAQRTWWPPVNNARPARRRQQDAADHAPVHPDRFRSTRVLGLRGGDPLEHISAGDEQSHQRADDRVRHQPGLVGEERRRQADLRKAEREIGEQAAQVAALGDAAEARIRVRPGKESAPEWRSWPGRNRVHIQGDAGGKQPADEQVRNMHGRRKRPAQIVEHLPAADGGNRNAAFGSFRQAPRPKIQGSSCQSPRAQRCWRAAAAS